LPKDRPKNRQPVAVSTTMTSDQAGSIQDRQVVTDFDHDVAGRGLREQISWSLSPAIE
jgi:hypothetical protein